MKLNLGCGQKHLDGYVNCDMLGTVGADKVFDLDTPPYPFDESSVDEILLDNVLEHLGDVVRVMEELHRILKVGGKLTVLVPYAKSDWAFHDPTHRHFFTEKSMDYFSSGFGYNFYSKAQFQVVKAALISNDHTPTRRVRNLLPFRSVLRHFFYNMFDAVHFELRKV